MFRNEKQCSMDENRGREERWEPRKRREMRKDAIKSNSQDRSLFLKLLNMFCFKRFKKRRKGVRQKRRLEDLMRERNVWEPHFLKSSSKFGHWMKWNESENQQETWDVWQRERERERERERKRDGKGGRKRPEKDTRMEERKIEREREREEGRIPWFGKTFIILSESEMFLSPSSWCGWGRREGGWRCVLESCRRASLTLRDHQHLSFRPSSSLLSLSPILDFHSSLLSLCFVFKSIFHPSSLLSTHSIPPMWWLYTLIRKRHKKKTNESYFIISNNTEKRTKKPESGSAFEQDKNYFS